MFRVLDVSTDKNLPSLQIFHWVSSVGTECEFTVSVGLAHVLMLALLQDSRRSEFFGTPLSEFAMHSTLKILYVRKAPIAELEYRASLA